MEYDKILTVPTGGTDSATAMAMMNNNHGYTQNAKVEVTSKSTDSVPSSEALITEIHQLLDEE